MRTHLRPPPASGLHSRRKPEYSGHRGRGRVPSGHGAVIDKVAEDLLRERRIVLQVIHHIFHDRLVNTVRIRVSGLDLQLCRVDPALRDPVVQVIPEADGIVLPCVVCVRLLVDLVSSV